MQQQSLRSHVIKSAQLIQAMLVITLLVMTFFARVSEVRAAGALSFTATATPTTVETGEIVSYFLDFSCGGVDGACGTLTIPFDYDETIFDIVTPVAISDGFTATVDAVNGTVLIEDASFQDGDAGQATIQLRVKRTITTGQTVPQINVSATITDPSGPPTITENTPEIIINQPTEQWSVSKTIVAPGGTTPPTVNDGSNSAYVRYEVNYCSDSSTGNLPINGAVLIDELPNDGAGNVTVNVRDIDGGTRIDADGTPNPNGIYVRWILSPDTPLDDTDDILSDSGCITRTVEYEFPDAIFDDGVVSGTPSDGSSTPSTTNLVRGYYDGEPTDAGVCVTDCIGDGGDSPTLAPPQGEPNPFKSISDERPIPFPGVANFAFGFNTNSLNVGMTNVTIGDDIPTAASDSRPALDVYEVFSGEWDNQGGTLPDATLRIIFENSDLITPTPATYIEVPVDGSGNTFTFGTPELPAGLRTAGNLITRVELEFPEVPPEFGFSLPARLDFTPRDGMAASDYGDPSPSELYANCAVMAYDDTVNPSVTDEVGDAFGGFNQGCADALITDDDTSIVNWSKGFGSSTNPAVIDNETVIEFALNLEYTDQSSGSLPSSFSYSDVLDGVLDFVDYASTDASPTIAPFTAPDPGAVFDYVTTGFVGGDSVPAPYLRLEYNTPNPFETRLTFIWSDDPTTDPLMDETDPALAGAVWYDINGTLIATPSAAPANGVVASAPLPGDIKTMTVNFKARVKSVDDPSLLGRAGTYLNEVTFDAGVPELGCQGSPLLTEECDANVNFTVREVAEISAFKWTQSDLDATNHIRPDRASYNGFIINPNFDCVSPVGTSRVLRNDDTGFGNPPFPPPDTTPDYSRSPCAAQANPGETFDQLLEITNDGNIDLNEFILYDILPHVGDTGVSQATINQQRLSEFEVWLADPAINGGLDPVRVVEPVGFAAATVVEYNLTTNPCRPEMSNSNNETDLAWMGTGIDACNDDWYTAAQITAATAWDRVRSFRVRQTDNTLIVPPSGSIRIDLTGYVPTNEDLVDAGSSSLFEGERAHTEEVAWNNFAYRFTSDSTSRRLLTAEPRKTGIRVPERLSIGNRVWIDDGESTEENDADDLERDDQTITNPATTSGSDEAGRDGVVLELYRWDGAGAPPAINADPSTIPNVTKIAETTTANGGYYLFETDQLASGDTDFDGTPDVAPDTPYDWIEGNPIYSLRPGRYFIYVVPENFNDPADPLYNFISSNGVTVITNEADDLDRGNDNGIGAVVEPPVNGVVSDWFDLNFDAEPEGEADVFAPNGADNDPNNDPYGPYGRGTFFQRDDYSNLTLDFGFIKPMALGNRIWIDDGRDTAQPDNINPALKNDGIFNGDELALDNVVVELYRDEDNSGTIDVGVPADLLATTTTENGGYYLFPNLKPGDYVVHIADVNFADTGWGDNAGSLEFGFGAANLPGPLYNYVSSTGWTTQQTDGTLIASFVDTPTAPTGIVLTDNGVDETDPATNGVSSEIITLERDLETQAEIDFEAGVDPDDDSGYVGNQAVENINNDLTVDFAFVQPPMSIGNVVWHDNGAIDGTGGVDLANFNDGIRNQIGSDYFEPGIENVRVNLYRDVDGDGTPDDLDTSGDISDGDIIGWTVTNADGYYLFDKYMITPNTQIADNADARDLLPGTYIVGIDDSNFTLGQPLFEYYSSDDIGTSSDDNTDSDDNGLGDYTNTPYDTNLLLSDTITIVPHGEPINEPDNADVTMPEHGTSVTEYGISTDGTQAGAIYTTDIRDDNSDRTWDFGVYKPMSIGNFIWLDMDNVTGTPGDGIWQAGEVGIESVDVHLYLDNNNDGDADNLGTPIATATTDAQGYYIFDDLPEGRYIIHLPASNFQFGANSTLDGALAEYISSVGTAGNTFYAENPTDDNGAAYTNPAQEDDLTDHGIDPATDGLQRTDGIFSDTLVLVLENETEGGDNEDVSGNIQGTYETGDGSDAVIADENSDLTVDFGFWEEEITFSLGNFVWDDINNDGVYDPDGVDNIASTPDDELPIEGVRLAIYRDDNNDGNPDTPGVPLDTISTDANGFYLFDDLNAGRHVVQILPENWTTGWTGGIYDTVGTDFGPLFEYISTTGNTGDTEQDTFIGGGSHENGIDAVDGDVAPADFTTLNEYQTNGILSPTILLEPEGEPIEEDTANDGMPFDDRGTADDDNSDLTVDFGLYRPMSIGNYVWLDDGSTATGVDVAQFNDGIRNGTEAGIQGVRVRLYTDPNGDGNPADGVTVANDTTDANGFYLFDGLVPGNYVVEIIADNFTAGGFEELVGLVSSYSPVDPVDGALDENDHGIDPASPTGAVRSPSITLTLDSEPLESDAILAGGDPIDSNDVTDGPDFRGNNNEQDDNSDRTVDFGFVAPPMAIGNRVWFDTNNDGIFDADGLDNVASNADDEYPIAGVTLTLIDNATGNPVQIGGIDYQVTTDADGYYLFDNLPEGNYVVRIDPSNFADGDNGIPGDGDTNEGALSGTISSTGNAGDSDLDSDTDENGIDETDLNANGTTRDEYQTFGVLSDVINLSLTNEPTGATEGDRSTDTATYGINNNGSNGELDENSNLTVDFGFYRPLSLGNRVWRDDGRDLAQPNGFNAGQFNDGILNGDEEGVDSVLVNLYRDTNGNGTLDAAELVAPVAQDTTQNGGYYLFDGLAPGAYIVEIPYSNFDLAGDPLYYHESSVPVIPSDENGALYGAPYSGAAIDDDSTDHGQGADAQITAAPGVRSDPITLAYTQENTLETDFSNDAVDDGIAFIGRNGETDNNSDITVDFGFYVPPMSLGNRVWYDSDNNGVVDGTDDNPYATGSPAIAGVSVTLFVDANNDGIADAGEEYDRDPTTGGTQAYTVFTDTDGYYLFDNLPPSAANQPYLVRIDPVNFAAGDDGEPGTGDANEGVLSAFISSTSSPAPVDATADDNDHGIDPTDGNANNTTRDEYQANGVTSPQITLAPRTEPDGADDSEAVTGTDGFADPDRIADDNSDLTVDFGFFQPLSIGNIVWRDNGATATGTDVGQFNNSLLDGTEAGIAGVRVELYTDPNNNGDFTDDGAFVAFDTTDANGYYLFDGLTEGNYIVHIPSTQFDGGILNGLVSSSDFGTAPVDATNDDADHGIDPADSNADDDLVAEHIANGVSSPSIPLSIVTDEPLESDTIAAGGDPDDSNNALDGPDFRGNNGEIDRNSDRTVDFGFVAPPLSLGNRVWFDTNNDGAVDAGDDNPAVAGVNPAIAGVTLTLIDNATGNPVQRNGVDYTVTTNADGYYLFDKLPEGDYVVRLDSSNWTPTTGVLEGLISSTDAVVPVDGDPDNDDHGFDQTDGNANNTTTDEYQANGILSPVIELRINSEPDGAADSEAVTGTSNDPNLLIDDNNSDLTVDFGLYRPLSLGNRVWRDDGRDLAQPNGFNATQFNDGILNGDELGINGVRVELYTDPNGDGDPADGVLVGFDITAAGASGDGYYLFDGLTQGNYVVQIPYASNFDSDTAPLWYHESSVPNTPADNNGSGTPQDDDSTDHGQGADTQITAAPGVRSASILLEYPETSADNTRPAESTAEIDLSGIATDGPNSIGTNGETDENSDITVDFGFYVPPMSLGNRVWYDSDNNGVVDGTDENPYATGSPAIAGVSVTLFVDANNDGIADAGEEYDRDPTTGGTQAYTVVTDADGYYLFDNLPPSAANQPYLVRIDPVNFAAGNDGEPGTSDANEGVLSAFISSTSSPAPVDATADDNDHGIDPADGDTTANNTTRDEYQANGVTSPQIVLTPRTEPDGADDSEAVTGTDNFPAPNTDRTSDDNSDLTVDFGFFQPLSIGNVVWLDDGSTASGTDPNQYNDGIRNGTEIGIQDVVVQLYTDPNGDGSFADGVLVDTDTTDANGYYLFDGLTEGDYIVHIPTTNFDATAPSVLQNYISSSDNGVTPTDGTLDDADSGIDPADANANGELVEEHVSTGVSSPTITLTVLANEPLESDSIGAGGDPNDSNNPLDGPDYRGNNGEIDRNSDRSVDFGFIAPPFSLGNRVWIDDGRTGVATFNPAQADDGLLNGAEDGINGVRVELYTDPNGDGNPADGVLVDFDITRAGDAGRNGYYLFDNLAPGNYVVAIPNSNFANPDTIIGNADDAILAPYVSSRAEFADNGDDNDDNGINTPDATYGILSPSINLAPGERTDDDDVSGVPVDGAPNYWGNFNEPDSNSDIAVDFGFVRPLAIGNRVWEDISRQSGATPGDGIRQADEVGIGGVTVELYLAGQTPGTDTPIATTITTDGATDAEDGFYLFDRQGNDQTDPDARRLGPGDYIVHIPASNFDRDGADNIFGNADDGVLAGRINSDVGANSNAGDTEVDSEAPTGDENGQNTVVAGDTNTYPQTAGVSSSVITLAYDDEVTGETDRDPNNTGDGAGVEDDNSDLTVDFGFYNGVAIGNRVWFDRNRNGLIDTGETNPNNANVGMPGVLVYLYEDTDRDGNLTGAELTPVAVDLTDSEGYYIFDVLDTNASAATDAGDDAGDLLRPGNYVVGIDPAAGNNPTVLANHISTITRSNGTDTPLTTGTDAERDNDDNGLDRRDVAPDPTIIYSEVVALEHFTETTGENAGDKETGIGDGRFNIRNESSDLTVDFGFFQPLSIGNRVWFDGNNNGVIDPTENGINDVFVELYRDVNNNNDPFDDPVYRTTFTETGGANGDGYYIFDDLPEDVYGVRLAPNNFTNVDDGDPTNGAEGALADSTGAPYSSSESGSAPQTTYLLDNQTDNNDNGLDENFPQTSGIRSNPITLEYGTEPDGADDDVSDLNPAVGEGTFGELDRDADMTIDFGVYAPLMSLGNRVFLDYDNDRIFNNNDVGRDNVVVNLFLDANQDGVPDSGINNPLETTTTANGGYYLFDGLEAGYYLVQIDEINFRPASSGGNEVLLDYFSSQDKANPTDTVGVPPQDDNGVAFGNGAQEDDETDHGADYRDPVTRAPIFTPGRNRTHIAEGVFSPTIHLVASGEIITEADLDTTLTNPDGEPNIQQSNSDLTVDFSFYRPMSIGNVLWFDTNGNGLQDNGEAGISGVEVELYRVGDTPGTDTPVSVYNGTGFDTFDTTDADGFYLFDNLPAGDYFVHIPARNFGAGQPLEGYTSTTPDNAPNASIAPAPDSDRNDNGETLQVGGISSATITLGDGSIPNNSEPVGEVNKSNNPPTPAVDYHGPVSIGRYGEIDANSDITIDFGFVLADTESMSIGNRVWFDTDRNGLIDGTDDNPFVGGTNAGIDGVLVYLYRANAAGNPIGAPIARDYTSDGGYYLFDALDTDATTAPDGDDGDEAGGAVTPGNYVVAIAPANFTAGQPLEGFTKTAYGIDNPAEIYPATGNNSDDSNDNGNANVTYGILSDLITLTLNTERDDETDKNTALTNQDGTSPGGNPITIANSNLTIDFGFYVPMSLGNRVWIDADNDGVFDTGESPVPDGVTLTLYESDGTTPFDSDPITAGTQTYEVSTINGYYLFEDLPEGDYVVIVDASNFATVTDPLFGYSSSDDDGAGYQDGDTGTDRNDNGSDATTPATDGIPSGVIELRYNSEPTGEEISGLARDGANGRGNNGELDDNSDLTVDFGVYPSTYYSLGNRVWIDTNGDGVHDNGEPGVSGVVVNLYSDPNGDGDPSDGSLITITNTDADGYYLFDELPAGNYIVSLPPANFGTSGALQGYSPTTLADPTDDDANDDEDHRSDYDPATVPVIDPTFGITSNTYTLGDGTPEPTGETAPDGVSPQDAGTDPAGNPIPDDQSNLTVDFGFTRTMSVGNVVWFDIDDDGRYEPATENGISGVTVELYQSGDIPGTDAPVATDVTDSNGYYLFDNLGEGDYFVFIPNANWTAGTQPLNGMRSSSVDAGDPDANDMNDNGTDNDGTFSSNTVAPADGVRTPDFTLAFGAAPTNDNDVSNNPADGPSFRGASNPTNNNSDLSRDFGFHLGETYSLGNRVWLDNGNTTGTPNNGILDGDEEGIADVIVELYRPGDVPGTDAPVDTDTTDNDGYYIFDGLPPGDYVVHIPARNWTTGDRPLAGYLSTNTGTFNNDENDADSTDYGTPDDNTVAIVGASSPTVTLGDTPNEPLNEEESPTDGRGDNGETDENSNLTVDFGFIDSYDWGDNPDTYGTTSGSNGANHRIVADLYMGSIVDDETSGVPEATTAVNTDGDNANDQADEDGVAMPSFVSGTTVDVDVTVVNDTGSPATLIAWFDWNGNGTFEDTEASSITVPDGTTGIVQLPVTIPNDAEDLTGGNTYARFRLTTDSIDATEPTGRKNSGEVEDYYIEVLDPGLAINKTDGLNAIVAGETNTYTITIENSGDDRLGILFRDALQIATPTDANGYDPETITWTCVATNGASCIAGQPAGTGSADGPFPAVATSVVIEESIDMPRDGRIVYTITGQVNPQAGLVPPGVITPLINVAQLPNEVPPIQDDDETAIIFDPPFGVKTGTVLGGTRIRWTMIWYNPGATQTGVTITDPVTAPQSLPATLAEVDLQCSGSVGVCNIVGNSIVWTGTMNTSSPASPADAVLISFNVDVPGPGTYTNTATMNFPAIPPVSSTSSVNIGGATNPPPGPILVDPAIVKFVDPALALPGELITWTIVVSNPNSVPISGVNVGDDMPAQLEILSASASRGTVTVNGQFVSVDIGNMAPQEEVTITVNTRMSNTVNAAQLITNIATLNINNDQFVADANASVLTGILELPATGETPMDATVLRLALILASLALMGGVGAWARHRRLTH